MRSCFRNSFICILALIAGPPGFAQRAAVSEAESGWTITVPVYNYANVSPDTLQEAEQEAGGIFRLEEIEIVWLEDPRYQTETGRDQASAHLAGRPATLYLTILPRSMAQRYPEHKNPYVFGFGSAPRAQGFASVFFDRVKEMARRKDSTVRPPLAILLGHVLAHEIAHALGCEHASTGLMQKEWSTREFTQIVRRRFLFTPSQGELLRTQARERSKRTEMTP